MDIRLLRGTKADASVLTHLPLDKTVTISQTMFLDVFLVN